MSRLPRGSGCSISLASRRIDLRRAAKALGQRRGNGQVAEWSIAHAWKACVGESLPRVRIPLCPPQRSSDIPPYRQPPIVCFGWACRPKRLAPLFGPHGVVSGPNPTNCWDGFTARLKGSGRSSWRTAGPRCRDASPRTSGRARHRHLPDGTALVEPVRYQVPGLNPRVGNSPRPFRRRERASQRFRPCVNGRPVGVGRTAPRGFTRLLSYGTQSAVKGWKAVLARAGNTRLKGSDGSVVMPAARVCGSGHRSARPALPGSSEDGGQGLRARPGPAPGLVIGRPVHRHMD